MKTDSEDRSTAVCAVCGAKLGAPGAPCPECTAVTAPEAAPASTPIPEPSEELELVRSALEADYEIIEELGRGGMAVVYRARERALERDVAIKVLPLARTFDAELVERFQREARLSASLEHPHIIPIYRVGQAGRVSFFVMKYVRGVSLTDMLEDRGRLEAAEVEQMLVEVGDALEYAHGHGVVHRDIKPDNIMKDQTDRYVVMDFGIAKSVGSRQLTQTGGSIGTPRYMSPEQGRGADVDGRSDFYSLGVVAYHCLVGRAPFEGDDALSILYSHLHDAVPEPDLQSERDRRVFSSIRRLLSKSPEDRPQSGREIRDDLGTDADTSVPSAASRVHDAAHGQPAALLATRVRDALRWLQARNRGFWIGAGAGLLLLVGLLGRDGAAAQCRAALPDPSEDDRALLLEPVGTVEEGGEIRLSYVACGLPEDLRFEARLSIRSADDGGLVGRVGRFFGGGEDPVRVSWEGRSDGFATSGRRSVSLGDLEPGSYRLILEIEGDDGGEAEASHDFTVLQR